MSKIRQLAVNIPVSVWIDGGDPEQALAGRACLVTRDSVRVRLPVLLATGTVVRLKAPFRSRSTRGRVHSDSTAGAPGADAELVIHAEDIGIYFGVVFPKKAGAKHEEEINEASANRGEERGPQAGDERPPVNGKPSPGEPAMVPQPLPVPSESPPSSAPSLELRPAPQRLAPEAPSRPVDVLVAGIDSARCPFSQAVTASLDAAGSLRAPMRQLIDLGARVRVIAPQQNGGPETPRHCRVYSRSPLRTADGLWMYRLVFESALDLYRDFEPATGQGAPSKQKPNSLLIELNTLRAALAALLYELRRKGVIEDDSLISSVLGREVPADVDVEELTAAGK